SVATTLFGWEEPMILSRTCTYGMRGNRPLPLISSSSQPPGTTCRVSYWRSAGFAIPSNSSGSFARAGAADDSDAGTCCIHKMSAWEPSSFLLVIAVVGLAIFRLWKMAMDNEEPVAGGSCGQQLS